MAASTEPKLKVPGESTTNPSFASPQIQTAPDVRQSQAVAGNAPAPGNSSSTGASPPSQSEAPVLKAPTVRSAAINSPSATPTASSVIPSTGGASQATVPTTSGAPPGVPQTAPAVPTSSAGLAPTPKALQGHNAAEDDWITAQNENSQKLYEAALAYNGGPTSALTADQQKAEEGLRTATNNRGAAGTIESSLFGDDKNLLATAKATDDLKAYNTYQESVTQANENLTKAQAAYERANEQEKREIAEAAERKEQTEAMQKAAAPPPAPALAGGVVPHESVQPGAGFVKVGMPLKKW